MVGAIYIYTFDHAYQKALKQYVQLNHQSMLSIHFISDLKNCLVDTSGAVPTLLLTDVDLDKLPDGFTHMMFLSEEPTVSNRALHKYQSFSELMGQALSYLGYRKGKLTDEETCQVIVVSSITGGAGKTTLIKMAMETAVSGNSDLVLQVMGGEAHPMGYGLSDFLWEMKKEFILKDAIKYERTERPVYHFKSEMNGNSLPGFTLLEDYRCAKAEVVVDSLKQYAGLWGIDRIWVECASAVDPLTEQLIRGSDVHLLVNDLSRGKGSLDVKAMQALWGITSPKTQVIHTITKKTDSHLSSVDLPYDSTQEMLAYRGALKNLLHKISVKSW